MAAGFLIPAIAAVLSGGVSAFQPGVSPSLLALRPASVSQRCGGAFRLAPPSPGKMVRLAPLEAKKKKKGDEGKSKMAPSSPSVKGKKDPVKETTASSSPKPSSPTTKPVPKAALVDDSGDADPDVLARAKAALDAARPTMGGVGIGGGPPVTENGVTLPENTWYGISGDAEILRATSKTVTVRLAGKFWGSRKWAFEEVEKVMEAELPGVKVKIEEAIQLEDLYMRDVFSDEDAWAVRRKGPQYVNEWGIQIAQPFNADGSIRAESEDADLLPKKGTLDEGALKDGIEEMLLNAMNQEIGTFLETQDSEEMRADDAANELAAANIAQAKESLKEKAIAKAVAEDDNIISVSKKPLEEVEKTLEKVEQMGADIDIVDMSGLDIPGIDIKSEKVGKALGSNPMFAKMADALEAEPGAIEEMMALLDKSNGNLFGVMMNPKFQKLATKMMANPELMQMMQDPAMLQDAMKSADDIGLTKQLGIDNSKPIESAADFTAKATEAVKKGLFDNVPTAPIPALKKDVVAPSPPPVEEASEESDDVVDPATPEWLQAKEVEVRRKAKNQKNPNDSVIKGQLRPIDRASALQAEIAEARSKLDRTTFFTEDGGIRSKGEMSDLSTSNFNLDDMMEKSKNSAAERPSRLAGDKSSFGDKANAAANENALYAGGFVFGVGGIVLFIAVQLGIVDIPFLPKDMAGISTPASRRMATPAKGAPAAPQPQADPYTPADDGNF